MHKEGVVTLLFFAIIAALIILHATSLAAAVTAVGGQTYNETDLLTGSGTSTNVKTTSSGGGKYSIS